MNDLKRFQLCSKQFPTLNIDGALRLLGPEINSKIQTQKCKEERTTFWRYFQNRSFSGDFCSLVFGC